MNETAIQQAERLINLGQWEEANKLIIKAFETAENDGDSEKMFSVLTTFGDLSRKRGQYEQALKLYSDALKMAEEHKLPSQSIYHGISSICAMQGEEHEALINFDKAIEISETNQDLIQKADTLVNRGLFFLNQGKHKDAEEDFKKALNIFIAQGEKSGMVNCNLNLSGLYMEQRNFQKAHEILDDAFVIAEEIGDRQAMGQIFSRHGEILMYENDFDDAITKFRDALEIWQEIGYKAGCSMVHGNLAGAYTNLGKYGEAETQYENALIISEKMQDHHSAANQHQNKGILHRDQGSTHLAIEEFNKAGEYYDFSGDKSRADAVAREIERLQQ